jgi:DNA-binding transcriptional regulator LsrR (DeoR family)
MPKKFNKSPMTRIQIADELGISTSTLKRKLKKANIKIPSGLIFRSDLAKIEELFYPKEEESR